MTKANRISAGLSRASYVVSSIIIAVVMGGGLFLLCACAKQRHPALTLTDAPLSARILIPIPIPIATPTAVPTRTRLLAPTYASLPSPSTQTLTIRKLSPAPATGIVLTDVLPKGVIPVRTQAAQPLCGRQERSVSCDVGHLQEGDTLTVTLDLSVGGTETLITGTQLAGVTLDLPARSNNHATFTMTVGAAGPVLSGVEGPTTVTAIPTTTDLVLQADGPSSVIAGQPFTYTFTITNRGPLDATGVSFENVLPPATILNAYAPGLPLCEQRGDVLTCYLSVPDLTGFGKPVRSSSPRNRRLLGSSETITFSLVITGHGGQPMKMDLDPLMPGWPICSVLKERTYLHIVNCEFGALKRDQATHVQLVLIAGGVQERVMANTASVSANEAELNPLDNTNTATITVQVRADLLVWSAISGPAFAGKTLSYTLTVANIGPSDASNVVLTDALPMGTSLVSAVPSQGDDCRIERDGTSPRTGSSPRTEGSRRTESSSIICSLGHLGGGKAATVTIVVAVDKSLTPALAQAITHSARVVAEPADPNLSNNELTESIPVNARGEY